MTQADTLTNARYAFHRRAESAMTLEAAVLALQDVFGIKFSRKDYNILVAEFARRNQLTDLKQHYTRVASEKSCLKRDQYSQGRI